MNWMIWIMDIINLLQIIWIIENMKMIWSKYVFIIGLRIDYDGTDAPMDASKQLNGC